MPSLGDSVVIIFIGLLLFGPKGLAQIARQLGKLMGEFRRASNEFRMQMEEELRLAEQEDRQKKIAAIEAAAPAPPVLTSSVAENSPDHISSDSAQLSLPAMEDAPLRAAAADTPLDPIPDSAAETGAVPIATSGDLSIMPPATGLPTPRTSSSLAPLIDSVPHVDAPNGHAEAVMSDGSEHRPIRYTNGHHSEHAPAPTDEVDSTAAAESVHG